MFSGTEKFAHFSIGHYGEHLCAIILNVHQDVEMIYKGFLF